MKGKQPLCICGHDHIVLVGDDCPSRSCGYERLHCCFACDCEMFRAQDGKVYILDYKSRKGLKNYQEVVGQ